MVRYNTVLGTDTKPKFQQNKSIDEHILPVAEERRQEGCFWGYFFLFFLRLLERLWIFQFGQETRDLNTNAVRAHGYGTNNIVHPVGLQSDTQIVSIWTR